MRICLNDLTSRSADFMYLFCGRIPFSKLLIHCSRLCPELENKSDFLIACSSILNHKLKEFSKLISEENSMSAEYPPLLLHLCIFVNVIKTLAVTDELMEFMLNETDFMNLVLKTSNKVLAVSITSLLELCLSALFSSSLI